jgi:hypothetical protein
MSQLPPDLAKASAGDYTIPITAIFAEAWQRIKGIKKAFWGGFALLFLILLGVYILLGFLLALCDLLHFYYLRSICQFFAGGIIEIWRLFISIALVFLALRHIREQAINASLVFEFRTAWKVFVFIGVLLYLFNLILLSGSNFILYKLDDAGFANVVAWGTGLRLTVFILLYSYITVLITMTVLLVLDKKISLKESFKIALQSINRHWFKNSALFFLATLLLLMGSVASLGIGVIWLLPWLSIIAAIQYQQIFCAGSLGHNK